MKMQISWDSAHKGHLGTLTVTRAQSSLLLTFPSPRALENPGSPSGPGSASQLLSFQMYDKLFYTIL